jgi:ATP-binding cassette, subfamily B, multidrug efflux pump
MKANLHKGIVRGFLLSYISSYRQLVAISLSLMLLVALSRMAPPYILKVAVDSFIPNGDLRGLTLAALIYLSSICLEYVAIYFQIYTTQIFGQSVIRDLRMGTFTRLLGLPVPYFDRTPHGKSLHYVTSDMENINEFITSGIVTTVADVITIVGILAVMLYLNAPLTGVVFVFFLFLFAVTNAFRKRFQVAYKENREAVSEMNGFLQESLAGIYVSKAFNRKDADAAEFRTKNDTYVQAFKRVIFYLSIYFPFVESVGILTILAILSASGGLLSAGALTFGIIFAFIEYSQKLYNPIRDLSEKYNLYQSALSSLEKLRKLHAMEGEGHPGDATSVSGDIEFRDVWLSYGDDDAFALKGVSLTIREGERVGIIGLTGSGKTSLINLMLGFYKPTRGEILIGGRPIGDYTLEALRRAFGIVSQDVFIFPRTLRENLFQAEGSAVPQAVEGLVGGFFDEGLEKTISEDGLNLSEGEKQLVSIGRLITYRPRFVILDEATSRIDRYLDQEVRAVIEREFSDSTWMVIAHRMATMPDMDRILVIHDGRLTEEGTHTELLAKDGIYAQLYHIHREGVMNGHLPGAPRRNGVE